MSSQWGKQSTRWSTSRRTTRKGAAAPAPPDPAGPDGQDVPATAPDTAEIYRTLFNQLRGAFGGAIDDANADAIAFAASELYHRDVEPKLWEQKTAQEMLDKLGVPRAGTFTRYSLADRLLLLRRTASPVRTDRAQALLTDLGVPELGAGGEPLSLKERLDWLLEGVGPLTPAPRHAGENEAEPAHGERAGTTGDGAEGGSGGPATQELVEALETIRQAAAADDSAPPPMAPAGPPAGDLVGGGAALATIQEELVQLRQAVQTVQRSLDDVLALLRAGTPNGLAPPASDASATDAPATDALATDGLATDGAATDATATDKPAVGTENGTSARLTLAAVPEASAPSEEGEPSFELPPAFEEASGPPLPEPIVAPEDVTQPVPVVESDPAAEKMTTVERHRRRGLPILILIAVVVGLLVAGVAILISMVGWNELRSDMGAVADVFATTIVQPLAPVRPPTAVG